MTRVNESYSRVPNKRVGPIKCVDLTFFIYVGEKKKLDFFFSKRIRNIRDLRVPKYKVNLSSLYFNVKITRIKTCFLFLHRKQLLGVAIKADISNDIFSDKTSI